MSPRVLDYRHAQQLFKRQFTQFGQIDDPGATGERRNQLATEYEADAGKQYAVAGSPHEAREFVSKKHGHDQRQAGIMRDDALQRLRDLKRPMKLLVFFWLAYFLIHSALASLRVKRWFARHYPANVRFYRMAFNLVSLILLLPILWQMQRDPGPLWWAWHGWQAWLEYWSIGLAWPEALPEGLPEGMDTAPLANHILWSSARQRGGSGPEPRSPVLPWPAFRHGADKPLPLVITLVDIFANESRLPLTVLPAPA